jgi:hypothetical protein
MTRRRPKHRRYFHGVTEIGGEAPAYATEGDLCDAFAAYAERAGWKPYAEVDGWDLVLVRDGKQIGVAAKLKANLEVLAQAHENEYRGREPHYRAVLVPACGRDFARVAHALRLVVYTHSTIDSQWYGIDRLLLFERAPTKLLTLPELALQGGGRPSPRTLSSWRIAALRLCIRLDERGVLTSLDFAEAKIDMSRWVTAGWLIDTGKTVPGPKGRPLKTYARGEHAPDERYADVKAALIAEMAADRRSA